MNSTCHWRFTFSFFVLLVLCLFTELTQAQTEELVSSMPESAATRTYGELYSESNVYESHVAVTDTRLRQYLNLLDILNPRWVVEAFVGANWQAQLSNQDVRYLTNAVAPSLGLRAHWNQWIYLTLEERYRLEYDTENPQNESDPRAVLSGGQFFPWHVTRAQTPFTEFYGEASWFFRLDSSPVATMWVKQGYRIPITGQLYVDPYLEFYSRQSENDDLGTTLNEGRAGGRLLYVWPKLSAAAHIYQPFASVNREHLAGMLVLGGVF